MGWDAKTKESNRVFYFGNPSILAIWFNLRNLNDFNNI